MENEKEREREETIELTEDMVVKDGGLKGKKGRVVITIAVILAAFLIGFGVWWSIETAKKVKGIERLDKQLKSAQAELNEIKTELDKLKEALAFEQEEKALDEALELATAKRTEGVEHTFTRQLRMNPYLLENDSELVKKHPRLVYQGDTADEKALKKWAQTAANILSGLFGYYDWRFGGEVRVKVPDKIAFLLVTDTNGKIKAQEYIKEDNNFKDGPERTNKLANNYSDAQFLGDSPSNLGTYVYIYVPLDIPKA